MPTTTIPLLPDNYYHIYNRANGSENLFREEANYTYFLQLYGKYISPVADTYAWCLMPNHFHLLVRVKQLNATPDRVLNPVRGGKTKPPHQYFSNLFNAYTQAINKQENRHGSLFVRPFKRNLIDNDEYLKRVVVYIHTNPVHHGFCDHPYEYSWSSYHTILSVSPTQLQRTDVLDWFDGVENFKFIHSEKSIQLQNEHMAIQLEA